MVLSLDDVVLLLLLLLDEAQDDEVGTVDIQIYRQDQKDSIVGGY